MEYLLTVNLAGAVWGLVVCFRYMRKFRFESKLSLWSGITGLFILAVSTFELLSLQTGSVLALSSRTPWQISYLTGLAICLPGLSRLFLGRKSKFSGGNSPQDDLLSRINEILVNSISAKKTSREVLQKLQHSLKLDSCAIYVQELGSSSMRLLAGYGSKEMGLPAEIIDTVWNKLAKTNPSQAIGWSAVIDPDLQQFRGSNVIPIRFRTRVQGILLIWGEVGESPESNVDLLKKLSMSLVGFLRTEQLQCSRAEQRRGIAFVSGLANGFNQNDSLETMLLSLSKSLKQMLHFEILSLAVINESGQNMERYTVNSEGALLLERGMTLNDKSGIFDRVSSSRLPLVLNNFSNEEIADAQGIFDRLNYRSLLGLPIRTDSRLWGVLWLGHSQPGRFDSVNQMTLRSAQYYLSFNLALRAAVDQGKSKEKLLKLLERLSDYEHNLPALQQKLEIITETLSRSLPVSSCRVSILGSDRDRLNTVSEFNLRPIKNEWDKSSALVDLPWHRMVMDSRKIMLVNQDDPESMMPTSEVVSAFHRPVNSALLVPLVVGKDSIGMLTLGEERTWARRPFSDSEIQTAHLVANRLADCFYRHLLEKKVKAHKESLPATRAVLTTSVRESLSDPLCGILGASELILAQSDAIDPRTAYYVQVIHKMAEKIKERVRV